MNLEQSDKVHLPDWKTQLKEAAQQLIELQEANKLKRQAQENVEAHEEAKPCLPA